MCGLPSELDRTGVRREHAADDFDEGGLAGPVVAYQPRDFGRWEVKGGVLQGYDGAEALAHSFHPKQGVRRLCGAVYHRPAPSAARSESPLPPIRAIPGKTIRPAISDRAATCDSVSLQSASDIGGPQSPVMAGPRVG